MNETVSVKKNCRLLSFLRNVDMRKVVWLFFVLSVLIRTLMNGFLKHAETYLDEWYYLQQAYDIAKGNGLSSIYGQYYSTSRWLYSLLIAPACLAENLQLRFLLIAFINSLILSSAIFPIWFIVKEFLHKKTTQICALLIFVTLPELNIGVTFMSDIVFFALATWLVWIDFRIVCWRSLTKRQRLVCPALCLALSMLSMMTKQTGILLVGVTCVAVFLIPVDYLLERRTTPNIISISAQSKVKKPMDAKRVLLFVLIGVSVVAALGLVAAMAIKLDLFQRALGVVNDFVSMFSMFGFKTMTLNHLLNMLLSLGILPWMFLLLSLRVFDRKECFQLLLLILMTGLCLFGAIPETFGSFIKGESDITRFVSRYLFYVFVPFMIFFLAAVERKRETGFSKWFIAGVALLCVIGLLAVWLRYPGNKLGSITDHAILFWAMDFKTNPTVAILLIHALVVLIFVMFYHPKAFLSVFMVLWLATQGYNNYASLKIYRGAYRPNQSDSIFALRDFISTHTDSEFILVGDIELTDRSVRYGDSFLDQDSVKRVTPADFNAFSNPETGLRDPAATAMNTRHRYMWWNYEIPVADYDYLILASTDASVPSGDVEHIPLGEDSWYTLYKINDTHNLPTLLSLRDIGPTEDGDSRTYILPVNAGYFQAQRPDENGLPSFVSAGEPGYLFIGPYLKGNGNEQPTLEPGFYTITIRYQVEGSGDFEGEIGYIELCGSEQEMLSEYLTPVYAGESEALIYLPVSDPIENFEMRFFANVEGVRVTEIEIIAEP